MKTQTLFDRTQALPAAGELSPATYNLAIGGCLGWGFLVNWLIIQNVPLSAIAQLGPYGLLIGFLASSFLGNYLVAKPAAPAVNFVGYNLIVIPFGIILSLAVARYDAVVVSDALMLTAVVTAIMMTLGSMYPQVFAKAVGTLTMALIAAVVVEMIGVFFLHRDYAFIDWIVVACFCGYIGYDWGRANAIPKTLGNAIGSSASLYMNIINLLLRIMRILGRRR